LLWRSYYTNGVIFARKKIGRTSIVAGKSQFLFLVNAELFSLTYASTLPYFTFIMTHKFIRPILPQRRGWVFGSGHFLVAASVPVLNLPVCFKHST
jgi:hypothetical protein